MVRRPPGFSQHVSLGEVEVRKAEPGPGGSGWWHPCSPKGIKRGRGGAAAAEEKRGSAVLQACPGCSLRCEPAWCLPRGLAASCTALPEAGQEPPARPRHTGRPRERCAGGESITSVSAWALPACSTLGKRRLGPALSRGSPGKTVRWPWLSVNALRLTGRRCSAVCLSVCLMQLSGSPCRHHVSEPP